MSVPNPVPTQTGWFTWETFIDPGVYKGLTLRLAESEAVFCELYQWEKQWIIYGRKLNPSGRHLYSSQESIANAVKAVERFYGVNLADALAKLEAS